MIQSRTAAFVRPLVDYFDLFIGHGRRFIGLSRERLNIDSVINRRAIVTLRLHLGSLLPLAPGVD